MLTFGSKWKEQCTSLSNRFTSAKYPENMDPWAGADVLVKVTPTSYLCREIGFRGLVNV